MKKTLKPGPKKAEGSAERVSVAVVLSRETVEMLDSLASTTGESRSAVLRLLIKKEFQKAKKPL